MYCKNCGNPMDDGAAVCVKCGCAKGTGTSYCHNCGQPLAPGAAFCTSCGAAPAPVASADAKSKLAAGLLGIFLGTFGVHNFYLGYTKKAVIQVLLGTVGCCIAVGPAISGIWGLVEGIMILCGNIKVDGKGNLLKD
ncbi:MAG: NINE protein [Faecousia sp.]